LKCGQRKEESVLMNHGKSEKKDKLKKKENEGITITERQATYTSTAVS